MNRTVELVLTLEEAFEQDKFLVAVEAKAKLTEHQGFQLLKRSIDARNRRVVVRVVLEIGDKKDLIPRIGYEKPSRDVSRGKRVVIIGAGPAGLFAAIRLIEAGVKPIILERGKDVQARRRDLAAINKEHAVNPDSNYCFGEGGAGTYSDGKLYTRSNKRGNVRRILEILVAHGAASDILIDAHPHIGTNKLPQLIARMRETILNCGGEVHFNSRVTDLEVRDNEWKAVTTAAGDQIAADACILATGHSARDIFILLHRCGIIVEAKPFAIGVRVEHRQQLIDRIQYHCESTRDPYLPASAYAAVSQVRTGRRERGVYSFCMCPGGFIVPAATAPGEVVVNGMSPSRRDSVFANSGIVVAVGLEDLDPYKNHGPLRGLHFQMEVEQLACRVAGGNQTAPAQRLVDFVEKKSSGSLPECSYQPGLSPVEIDSLFPSFLSDALRSGFRSFGSKMKGYLTNEAQIIGVESRTSSPVRIPRDNVSLEHPQAARLFPCGEGAGYAGGIVSAAMDGERCANAFLVRYKPSR